MAEFELDNRALNSIVVTVKVRKKRLFDFRLWLGCQLIKIGAMIAGLSFQESETEH